MYYTILSSSTIRSNSIFNVIVGLHEGTEACKIKISIEGETFNVCKVVEVQRESLEVVKFEIPTIPEGDYTLQAEGISGLEFKDERDLTYSYDENMILIQTDKPIYNPGDIVKIWVLILDHQTRPAVIWKPVTIYIKDGKGHTIKRFANVEANQSVCCVDLQLSHLSVLGEWTIDVYVNDQFAMKNFSVNKYVLPKFEFNVEVPRYVALVDKAIEGTATAMYTFGKPVEGEIDLVICKADNKKMPPVIVQTIPLSQGVAHFSLNISDYLEFVNYWSFDISFEVSLKEKLTGTKRTEKRTVTIHKYKYEFNFVNAFDEYIVDDPLILDIEVVNMDGSPVKNSTTPLRVEVVPITNRLLKQKMITFEKIPDQNGKVVIEYKIPPSDYDYMGYSIELIYPEGQLWRERIFKSSEIDEDWLVVVTPERPKIGDIITVTAPIDASKYFFYILVGYRGIHQAGKIQIPDNGTVPRFNFKMELDMYPSFIIAIYFIEDDSLKVVSGKFDTNYLRNFIKLRAPEQSKGNEIVDIEVDTNPNSFVSLFGVEKGVKLMEGENVINQKLICQEFKKFDTLEDRDNLFSCDIEYISNASADQYHDYNIIEPDNCCQGNGKIQEGYMIPDTWKDLQDNNAGRIVHQEKIPDTLHSWIVSAFVVHPEYGLGFTEVPTSIKISKSFFAISDLPYSVKRGEVISIPIFVFNYLDTDTDAEISLDNSKGEFEFISIDENSSEIQMKIIKIEKDSYSMVSFQIIPKKVGEITIGTRAKCPKSEYAFREILRVEPEGVTKFHTKPIFIKLDGNNECTKEFDIEIPDSAVPDSTSIEISIFGNLLFSLAECLERSIESPYTYRNENVDCFKQNFFILKYLKYMNRLNPDTEKKIKQSLEIGYRKELRYRRNDSSSGDSSDSGEDEDDSSEDDDNSSICLPACLAQSFYQAKEFIEIDERLIENSFSYIITTQTDEGYFDKPEYLLESFNKSSKDLSETALTLLALLDYEDKLPDRSAIEKALEYLEKNIEQELTAYPLAIIAYVFQKVKHIKKDIVLKRLLDCARLDDDRMWWTNNTKTPRCDQKTEIIDIEITSYALMALLESNFKDHIVPVLRWLLSRSKTKGKFISKKNSVVQLAALVKLAQQLPITSQNIHFKYSDDHGTEGEISLNESNSVNLQSCELSPNARKVKFVATGTGLLFGQISYQFNIFNEERRPRFNLKLKIDEEGLPNTLKLSILSSFIPVDDEISSNTAIMEVALPNKYLVRPEDLLELKKTKGIKLVETSRSMSLILIYFENMSSEEICSIIHAHDTNSYRWQNKASILIYNSCDNGGEVEIFYEVPKAAAGEIEKD